MKKELSKSLKRFYGVGDFGFNLMSSVESYYFNFFLTNLAGFSMGIVALITTISSTVDACLSWVYGAFLNSMKPKKWGRYRSWLLLVPWIVPFLYAFQFIKLGDGVVSIVIIIVAAIISHIVWNFAYVANVSMINVAGKDAKDRIQLSSTRGAWSNFSKIIFSYAVIPVAALASKISETNKYGAVAFVFGVLFAVLYYVHFRMFKGYEETEEMPDTATVKKDKTKTGGKDLLKALFQNPPLISLLFADLAKWMFNFVVMGTAVYYFTYIAQDKGLLATYILISNILCVIGSYCSKFLAGKLSTRITTISCFIGMAILLIIAYFAYTNVWLVIVLMSLAQFGYGVTYACTPALYGDTIVYSEWKTGKNATGWVMGLQNLPLKIGVMARGIIISAVLAAAAFNSGIKPEDASVELMKGICNGFMIIPAIALIIGAVLLIAGFRLTREKIEHYQTEIAARN